MKLTQDRIRKLTHGRDGEFTPDDEQKGLLVRVTAGGAKTYYAQYQHAGRKVRMKIGAVDAISLVQARDSVKKIMGAAADGRDPASERKEKALAAKRKAAHDALTLDALVEDWVALHLSKKRPSYAAEAPRAIRKAFAKLLDLPAAGITRTQAVHAHDALVKKGSPVMAARAAEYARTAYAWAVKPGTLTANPFAALPTTPTTKRERVLKDDELCAVWKATSGPSVYNSIVRMLILTGQRREEVAGMRWGEISQDGATWTIPAARAKNGKTHIVPLSVQARVIVKKQPRRNDTTLVFPGGFADRPLRGFSWPKDALDKASGVTDWRLHDLRRTAATGLQKLGVRLEVTEAVLNHVSGSRGGIVGVYQRHDWAAEKKAALQSWADRVQAIVEGRTIDGASNVVAIRA
jgi:integrase